jgi:hypothetical protein
MSRFQKPVWWRSLVGFIVGFGLGWWQREDWASLVVAGLPDLHPAAEPLPHRPDPVRYDGGREPPGGLPVTPGGDVSPKHVTLNQIFAGMMPYMLIVPVCLMFMDIRPGMRSGCLNSSAASSAPSCRPGGRRRVAVGPLTTSACSR